MRYRSGALTELLKAGFAVVSAVGNVVVVPVVCAVIGAAVSAVTSVNALADQGDDAAFFQQRSQHAYNAVFGLPMVAPRIVQSLEWQISLEHNNQFAGGSAGDERLVLDGETTRLSISHRQRLGSCWQGEVTLPFISHNGGVFDRAIDDWHQFFSLPDANRGNSDFNQLTYFYEDADGIKHDITRSQSGIGDVQLAVQYAVNCGATADSRNADTLLRAGIKLPTGSPGDLTGSGEVDVFADWQSPVWRLRDRWYGGLSLGVLLTSSTDRFADQRNVAAYGSLGLQFAAWQKLRLIAQLDGHSAFYKSRLKELGDPALNLAVGARYLLNSAYTLELSISEDVAIDTTPDIVGRLAVTYRPVTP